MVTLPWMSKLRKRIKEYADNKTLTKEIKQFITPLMNYGGEEEIRITRELNERYEQMVEDNAE